MQVGANKLGLGRIMLLGAMCVLALFAAFIVVPIIAESSGLNEKHVNYAVAAVAFLIVIVATRRVKSLNKKSRREKN